MPGQPMQMHHMMPGPPRPPAPPGGFAPMMGGPRPPMPQKQPPPPMDDEPPNKKQKTEDQLIDENVFLQRNKVCFELQIISIFSNLVFILTNYRKTKNICLPLFRPIMESFCFEQF